MSRFSVTLAMLLALWPVRLFAQNWNETGDAPDLPPGQATVGAGPLVQINGNLAIPNDVDLFLIQIVNPGIFQAQFAGPPGFDSQLFLFSPGGMGVAHNDNLGPGVPASQLSGMFVPGPGMYLLGISGFDRDPVNPANQPIWNDNPRDQQRPPDGPGAPGPVTNWNGNAPPGPYTIMLNGATFSSSPPLPQITQHPVWQPVELGGTAMFGVTATGAGPLAYQWFHAGNLLSGATGPTITISNAQEPDYGPYYVRVTDSFDQTVRSRSADLTVHVECVPPIANPGSCYIPDVWRIDPVPWNRDVAPQNKIDDLLDADPGVRHDIIVDFRECVTIGDIQSLEDLDPQSSVTESLHVITTVGMSNVSYTEMLTIAGRPDVALIERDSALVLYLDVSLQAMRVIGPAYSPATVEDVYGFTGAGFNIAIMDTGVDDTVHDTFTGDPSMFVAGYDTFTDTEGNPDDDFNHGTYVASIALGRGGALVARGVAPEAGLIDVKVGDSAGDGTALGIMRAMQRLLDRQRDWSVHIVNMSFGLADASNGVESVSQLTDRMVEQGMIVVAAAGNSGDFGATVKFPPGRAARAITVGALDDEGTPTRADDFVAGFSQWGPAIDNGNTDEYDELKPEVVAPGVWIVGAGNNTAMGPIEEFGTSFAAPHVAGLAALCLQGEPSMNPEGFRALLINTSERLGPPSLAGIGLTPAGWNNRSGWGMVDAYAAIARQVDGPTDVTFGLLPVYSQWDNRNIGPITFPPLCGVENAFFAVVRNAGTERADNIRVTFGVHNFSASAPPFIHVGTAVIGALLAGESTTVEVPWIPNCSELSAHQCLKVEIGCDNDLNPLNNKAQRNLDVTSSPAYFEAANYAVDSPVTITFVPEWVNPGNGWGVQITPPSVTLAPQDLPPTIEVLPLPPPGTPDGAQELLEIKAETGGGGCLGGVAIIARMRDCNGNGVDDWFDINVHHTSVDGDMSGVPDECEVQPANMNCDMDVNSLDIMAFVTAVIDPSQYAIDHPGCNILNGDINEDTNVNSLDTTPFIECILNAGCP